MLVQSLDLGLRRAPGDKGGRPLTGKELDPSVSLLSVAVPPVRSQTNNNL